MNPQELLNQHKKTMADLEEKYRQKVQDEVNIINELIESTLKMRYHDSEPSELESIAVMLRVIITKLAQLTIDNKNCRMF
jgi:hypothetical protein